MMKKSLWITWLLAGMLVLSACAPQTSTPPASRPTGTTLAPVDTVEVLLLESFPVQVNVVVEGMLPDACTTIGPISQRREGDTFFVEIATIRPDDEVCAQVLTPYEEVVSLDVDGLSAGDYGVYVNGVEASFTLTVDNVLDE